MIVGGTLLLDRVANSIADLRQPFRIRSEECLNPKVDTVAENADEDGNRDWIPRAGRRS